VNAVIRYLIISLAPTVSPLVVVGSVIVKLPGIGMLRSDREWL
jgi:hypothetical protein